MEEKKQRVFGIDLARGSAAFMLVTVHTLWMYGRADVQFESGFGSIIHTFGQATALFLLAMGISFVLTPHQSIGYGLKRAAYILIIAYALNGLKFIVPIELFGTMPEEFIRAYGWQSPLTFEQLLYLFLTGDILQMAGIAFAFIAVIRHFVRNKYVLLLLSALSIATYPLISGYRPGIPGVDYICDLLWGTEWNVYFPLLPWISNILVGMFVGMYFKEKNTGVRGLYQGLLLVGIPCSVVGGILCYRDWGYHFNDFFHPGPGGALLTLGVCLFIFFLFCYLSDLVYRFEKLRSVVFYLSSRVTTIYVVQWVLVCWGMGIVGYQSLDTFQVLLLIPLMTLLTVAVDYAVLTLTRILKSINEVRYSGA